MNEYGFYEVSSPAEAVEKDGRIYVLSYVKDNMFYHDNHIIKCNSLSNNEKMVYEHLESHPNILKYLELLVNITTVLS